MMLGIQLGVVDQCFGLSLSRGTDGGRVLLGAFQQFGTRLFGGGKHLLVGRNAGYIALNVAIASGAMAVLLPEKEFDMQRDILDKIVETQRTGKRHFIVIVAEGIGHSQEIANEIQARTGIDTRATILGHVQRGGSPTLRDRVNASAMGYHAVCLLEQGKYNRIVGMKGEELVDYPVDEALEMTKSIDPVLVDVCNTISI